MLCCDLVLVDFFFNDTATTEIYTLSLHDALPIHCRGHCVRQRASVGIAAHHRLRASRSEEHTSELQSRFDLVCRLPLEKKNKYSNCVRLTPRNRILPPFWLVAIVI